MLQAQLSDTADSPASLKRRRANRERARVTRACDRCKRRKAKCNGNQPCAPCVAAKSDCTYEAIYTRGRAPAVHVRGDSTVHDETQASQYADISAAASEPSLQTSSLSQPQQVLQTATLDTAGKPSRRAHQSQSDVTTLPSSQDDSPEPSQTDLQGHYIGPASGVSFLLRVQKRLHQSIAFSDATTIFTFGDAPLKLPDFEPSFCMMLPREDAQHLVSRYFEFAMPTYRFLHQPTIQEYFDEFYDTLGTMRDAQTAPAKIALLFMVFAHARVYMPDDNRPGPDDLSTRYFLAAEHQLERERGSISLTSIQARLTQCYYLLTQSRINHCWSLFGTVSHLGLAIGLNRNRRPSVSGGISVLEAEGRRRTFWCAYTLDAYLSVALGRPRTFHDDDIDAEFPACVDDDQITKHTRQPVTSQSGPSTMLASVAHIKLARILAKIVRDLYAIKPISTSRRALVTERISRDLSDWRVGLTQFLDASTLSPPLLGPIFHRQRNVLNLTYWHAIILTYRPYLLNNLARLSRRESTEADSSTAFNAEIEESVKQCLSAAMNTVETIDEITSTSKFFGAFWVRLIPLDRVPGRRIFWLTAFSKITAYFAFTATIVLYIHVIQKRACVPEVYGRYFVAATRCQSHLAAISEEGSLSQRYCLVLEELRIEAIRQVKRTNRGAGAGGTQAAPEQQQPTEQGSFMLGDALLDSQSMDAAMAMMGMFDESPSAMTNYTDLLVDNRGGMAGVDFQHSSTDSLGWDQFASMVSLGLGNLDGFL